MDLNHVAIFVRVVEAGSFTGAADSFGLPKSSVSRSVSRLEEELGVRLLARTTRSLHLTEPGRAFYERARHALESLEEAAEAAGEERVEPKGVVRLTIPTGSGGSHFAALLTEFSELHPLIHIDLVVTNRHVDLVSEGFDLALRGGVLEDSDLVARTLGKSDSGLFASAAYLKAHGAPSSVGDLINHRCVLFGARGGRQEWTLSPLAGPSETVEVTGPMSADEVIFVQQAIEAGAGIGLVPLTVLARCKSEGQMSSLVRVLPDYAKRGAVVSLISQPLEMMPRRARLLRDFLATRLVGWFVEA